jgi:hypothetical protein
MQLMICDEILTNAKKWLGSIHFLAGGGGGGGGGAEELMSNSMLKFGTPLFFLLKNFLTPHPNYINNPHGFISVAFQGRRKLFLIGGGG